MTPADRAALLAHLATLSHVDVARLYNQQELESGTPKRLHEDDRLVLAQFIGIDERLLGARDPWSPGQS